MSKWKNITKDYLHEILKYNSGLLVWKVSRGSINIGKIAGSINELGYVYIGIDGSPYEAHRIILILNGICLGKADVVDHIDGNPTNNLISNLRVTTMQGNQRNRCRSKNNTSGVTGVSWSKARNLWVAKIKVNSKTLYLGGFEIFSEAVDSRKNAEVLYGFHENHDKIKGDFE